MKPSSKNLSEGLEIYPPLVCEILVDFIHEEVTKVGFSKVILGLSGGIDSALVAFLAARALGKKNVLGLRLPYKTSSSESVSDAKKVVDKLGIRSFVIEITPMVDAYFDDFRDASMLRRGNKMARERMSILYDLSAKEQALVLGTSNKTELLLGYGTQFGDLASAINPIGDLYKTQVRQLSKHLKLPKSIIDKAPTADLWVGQSDEVELGYTYEYIDQVLYYLIDERRTREEMVELGFDPIKLDKIHKQVQNSQFKRRLPIISKLSLRTIERDFRYARDWGK